MVMGMKQVLPMLTPEQIANYKTVCIVPLDPGLPLTKTNVAVVPNDKARRTIRKWWKTRDNAKYSAEIELILSEN